MPKKTKRRMQHQLQNLALMMATSLSSQLFFTCNRLSLRLFFPLYFGISSGRWGGNVIWAGDTIQRNDLLSSPILICVGVPSVQGDRRGCAGKCLGESRRPGGDGGRRTERSHREGAPSLWKGWAIECPRNEWGDSPSHRALATGAADLLCSGAADVGAAPTQRK